MAKILRLRRGTAEQHVTFKGLTGEITVDTTNNTIRVHDDATLGGHILATKDYVDSKSMFEFSNISIIGNNISTTNIDEDINLIPNGNGNVVISSNLIVSEVDGHITVDSLYIGNLGVVKNLSEDRGLTLIGGPNFDDNEHNYVSVIANSFLYRRSSDECCALTIGLREPSHFLPGGVPNTETVEFQITRENTSLHIRGFQRHNYIHFDSVSSNIGINTFTPDHTFTVRGDLGVRNGAIYSSRITTSRTNQDLNLEPNGAGAVVIHSDLLPSENVTYNLGSPEKEWNSLYVSGNTIYIGGSALSIDNNGNILVNGNAVVGGSGSISELAYLELTNQAFGEAVEFNNTGEDGGVDEISEGLHITRGQYGWLYNPLEEEESGENTPTNSLWNNDGWNDLTDIEDRDYVSLATIWQYNFRSIVGAEMVMLDTTTDKYYAVKITRWSRDSEGFSYVRYELNLDQLQEGITFADGTIQKTAYVATNVKLTAEGDRRIEEVAGYKSVSLTSRTVDQEFTGVTLAPNSGVPWDVFIDGTVYTELYAYVSEFPNEPITLLINGVEYQVQPYISGDIIVLYAFDPNSGGVPVSYSEGDAFTVTKYTGGEPVVWWNKNELPGGSSNFRGAVIDYHAYTGDGTIIGTIHIVDDSGEEHITHTEVSSGSSSSLEANDLWFVDNEGTISYRRLDYQERTLRIQWTAKVFYGSEYYD